MSHQGFTSFVLLLLLITPYSCVGNIREAGTTWGAGGTPEYLYMLFGRFHMHAKIPHPSEVHRFHPFLNNADKEHNDVRERSLPPPIVPARGKALASRPATGQDSCNKQPHITLTRQGQLGCICKYILGLVLLDRSPKKRTARLFCPSGVICAHRLFPIYITTPIALSRSSPIVPKTKKRLTVGPHPPPPRSITREPPPPRFKFFSAGSEWEEAELALLKEGQ